MQLLTAAVLRPELGDRGGPRISNMGIQNLELLDLLGT
jgi:hypothetical protein